jgi:Fe-coproporphyrin III synthase
MILSSSSTASKASTPLLPGRLSLVDAAIIVTYRCNAHCAMCHTWQFPTKPAEEFAPDLLRKLPNDLGRVNITGGEPLIRRDLPEIVDILAPKARRLEISTNGYFTERLAEIGRRHPELTVRISMEGLQQTNDHIRGIHDGFDHAVRSYHALREVGVRDLGFAVVIQDDNAHDLLNLYEFISGLDAEFAQAVPHNSYYFHTNDNHIQDVEKVQAAIRQLIEAFLRSRKPKEWFRAYLNRGLVDYVGGTERRLECTAGTDIIFLDPHGEVYPCNGWDLSMGNLHKQSFEQIWDSERAKQVRAAVTGCERRCWMTGTAVPAMRHHLPAVTWWVLRNKVRVWRGQPADLTN